MKPALVLISILAVLGVIGLVGHGLGQLGGDDSDQEVRAGLSDLASALTKIGELEQATPSHPDLQEFHSCWPKIMEVDLADFSEPEHTAMTMVMLGMLMGLIEGRVRMSWPGNQLSTDQMFDRIRQECAALK